MRWMIIRMAGLAFLLLGVLVSVPDRAADAHPVPNPCFDFVTGGGWFQPAGDGPDQANFGFNFGYKNGEPPPPLQVHINYIDHNTGRHVKINGADDATYEATSERCRAVLGSNAESNGETGLSYVVEVCDNGEPGNAPKGNDRFRIVLSNGYSADSGGYPVCSGDPDPDAVCGIDGGNIQLHKSCTGVDPK